MVLTATLPEPAFPFGVSVPYEVDVPYSTHHVVASPPGTTVPVTVAVVDPIDVAGPVVAVGAAARAIPPKSIEATPVATTMATSVRVPVTPGA
jgi:hypothetical protein